VGKGKAQTETRLINGKKRKTGKRKSGIGGYS